MEHLIKIFLLCLSLTIVGCAPNTSETMPPAGGSPVGAAIGGAAGLGAAALLGAPKPVIGIAGIAGAGLGYYLSSLRFAGRGVIDTGGQIYTLGDMVIINVPTDNLFDANTAEFLPGTDPILASIAKVLKRYPANNIFISGNTSGFWTDRFEKKMSECRASQIAAYLWAHGVSDKYTKLKEKEDLSDSNSRRLIYVGYGDKFPIANQIRIKGIRANSRIQIVASPTQDALNWNCCKNNFKHYENVGDVSETSVKKDDLSQYAYAFPEEKN
jgi:outer membrane protein OmpA-like peptidoglycan-associated protein